MDTYGMEDYFPKLSLADAIIASTEYLETTEGDSIPCISIEELTGILLRRKIITLDEMRRIEKETE
jgi:hypothetical protein